jgi:competence protein ComEC
MEAAPYIPAQASDRPARAGLGAVPLFHAAWLFAVGIAATHWFWLRPGYVLMALGLVAILCIAAAVQALRLAWLPLCVLWLLLGAWCAEMEPQPAPAPKLGALSDGLMRTTEGTVVDAGPVRGEMEEDPDEQAAAVPSQRIDLSVSSLEVVTDDDDSQTPVEGIVRLNVRWPAGANEGAGLKPFRCGDRIRALVQLRPPDVYHDPGVWSREEYQLAQGISSSGAVRIARVERLGRAPGLLLGCRIGALQHASSARLLALPTAMRRMPAPLRLGQDDAIMLAAMVTGDRTYLTHSLRVGFERTGSFHMLVVSGFHLAIVSACIFWIARRLRLSRVPATLVTIVASFGYALFAGFALPVQRSLWMVSLYLIGRLFYRERIPMNTIGFAALCLLAVNPLSLFDSSLQMTLLAVVAIGGIAAPLLLGTIHPYVAATRELRNAAQDVKLAPRLAQFRVLLRMVAGRLQAIVQRRQRTAADSELEPGESQEHPQLALFQSQVQMVKAVLQLAAHGDPSGTIAWRFFPFAIRFVLRLGELLVVSLVVELAMALPMALYFHRITIFALPVNVFILPLLAVLMPAALVTLAALFLWPAAAVVPAMVVAVFLHFSVWLVRVFGSMEFGDFRIPAPLLWQSAAFCALLGAAILLAWRAASTGARWQRGLAWAALLLAALSAVVPRAVDHPRDALLVEAIDVGQGDSLLLITPEGKTLLVDGGGFGGQPRQAAQEFDIGEEVVSEALWARGIRRLDVVALSHAHSDHMGGLPAVLRNFRPAALWVGNNPRNGPYDALLNQAAVLGVRVRSLRAGDTVTLGSARVSVLAPFPNYQPKSEPTNNDSLVLHVAYGATSVLLEGDAEGPIEDAMLAEPGLRSTLLKVGHHGSKTSTHPEFLARVAPQWAVISCGRHNRYGHPKGEVLQALEAAHVRTYSTDIGGMTCFRLDGKAAANLPCEGP